VTGSWPLRLAVAGTVAVLAVLTAALAAVAAVHLSDKHALKSARQDAMAAAQSGVPVVLSYDYRHLDSDFSRAEKLLTPRFRPEYVKTTVQGVKPAATKYKARSTAVVTAVGSVTNSADRAVVMVFVNQEASNTLLTAKRLDQSRINVALVRDGDRWLIDNLSPL